MNLLISIITLLLAYLTNVKGDIYRLPPYIQPTLYNLTLDVNVNNGEFSGDIHIDLKIFFFKSYSIKLHMSPNLAINEILLDDKLADFKLKPEELLEVSYKKTGIILPGPHQIRIKYDGRLVDKTNGFFKAKYTDLHGRVLSELGVTDFEPTYARTAFPCFDEPAFKAKFKIAIIVRDENYTAISNMERTQKLQLSQGYLYDFETSVLMSTYLVAFAIIPYNYVETTVQINNNRSIPIRIWSHNVTERSSRASLKYASHALKFFTHYLDFADPMPKIDFVDYDRTYSEATENWGLITTAKDILQGKTNRRTKFQIASTIMHEIAHFWFGNLVTNNWWDDLWLQEGFAEYLSIKATNELKMNTEESFIDDIYKYELNSEPVVKNIQHLAEIEERFGEITYSKGAAILRMLEFTIGENLFRRILREYIKQFKFKTAKTVNFLDIVGTYTQHLKVDVRGFLDSYLNQNGYPVLNVEINFEKQAYILKQQSSYSKTNHLGSKWTIPVSYYTNIKHDKYKIVWFDKDSDSLVITANNSTTFTKFNYKNLGIYRVNYSEYFWKFIIYSNNKLDNDEKVNLLYEAVDLFIAGLLSCQIPLQYFERLRQDNFGTRLDGPMNAFLEHLKSVETEHHVALKRLSNYLKQNKISLSDESGTERRGISHNDRICLKWIKENLICEDLSGKCLLRV